MKDSSASVHELSSGVNDEPDAAYWDELQSRGAPGVRDYGIFPATEIADFLGVSLEELVSVAAVACPPVESAVVFSDPGAHYFAATEIDRLREALIL